MSCTDVRVFQQIQVPTLQNNIHLIGKILYLWILILMNKPFGQIQKIISCSMFLKGSIHQQIVTLIILWNYKILIQLSVYTGYCMKGRRGWCRNVRLFTRRPTEVQLMWTTAVMAEYTSHIAGPGKRQPATHWPWWILWWFWPIRFV